MMRTTFFELNVVHKQIDFSKYGTEPTQILENEMGVFALQEGKMQLSNLYVRVNEIESGDIWSEFVGPAEYSFIEFS